MQACCYSSFQRLVQKETKTAELHLFIIVNYLLLWRTQTKRMHIERTIENIVNKICVTEANLCEFVFEFTTFLLILINYMLIVTNLHNVA